MIKKRILIICKGHRNVAGAQLYLKQISLLFSPSEYDLHFAFHKNDGTRFFDEISVVSNVTFWEYDWRHMSTSKSLIFGYKLFRKIKPDYIIFNSSEDEILGTVWAAFLSRIPHKLMVVHWAQSSNSLRLFKRKKRFPIPVPSRYSFKIRIIRSISFQILDKIIFVNKITRQAYLKLYKVSPKKCITIYNGIDTTKFSGEDGQRKNTREKLGLDENDCMVFASGNLTEVKGHRYLVSAIKMLVEKGYSIKCYIAGQGELKESLEQQVKNLDLSKYVKLLGYRNDIPLLLTATDIFCMPSLSEALGYSLIEALSSGIPVIASNVGGIPEVVEDGKEGVLVPPMDAPALCQAIETLFRDRALRNTMSIKGKKTVNRKFSIERMLEQTGRLFQIEINE